MASERSISKTEIFNFVLLRFPNKLLFLESRVSSIFLSVPLTLSFCFPSAPYNIFSEKKITTTKQKFILANFLVYNSIYIYFSHTTRVCHRNKFVEIFLAFLLINKCLSQCVSLIKSSSYPCLPISITVLVCVWMLLYKWKISARSQLNSTDDYFQDQMKTCRRENPIKENPYTLWTTHFWFEV